jgi:membrane protease YdiL (CAAX protease family)
MSDAPDDRLAQRLRGLGPLGVAAWIAIPLGNLLFLPLSALLVLAWAWRSGTPWSALGLVRPRRWALTVALGIVLGVALKLLSKSILLPLLHADSINHTYHYLVGNRAAVPFTLYQLVIGAGFGEEVLFRGFFFERLGRLLGTSTAARAGALLLSSALFAVAHLADQGVMGASQALLTGMALGGLYLATGSLALPMVTHAAFDLFSYWIIYFNLETRVAHLVFR